MNRVMDLIKNPLYEFREASSKANYIMNRLPFYFLHKFHQFFSNNDEKKIYLIAADSSKEQIEEIMRRCSFYIPNASKEIFEIKSNEKLSSKILFGNEPLLIFGNKELKPSWIYKYRYGIFNVDYFHNPSDGWTWHDIINYMSKRNDNYLSQSKSRFTKYIKGLKSKSLNKCYIFGTGPSLETARNRDWSDGYVVVCNTIVRDKELWEYLNPDFIVAGDAIYHFGHTSFAKEFRKDLALRLSESETMFVYPDFFHELVSRELSCVSDHLIPIPGGNHNKINVNLLSNFSLPCLGNVLNHLLLPLACTLSKNVYMFGFDGRSPKDKLFWSNSNKHSYPEFMEELQRAHPCFFEYFVPKDDPCKYVKDVHGDQLDECMKAAESEGWHFLMMHKSWTPTLQKRFIESYNSE